ncbi:unnamed protein product [Prunus brigantina]
MNLRFGMMTPTVLDMATLFGLSPLGVEVNAALVAPEAEGSFKGACPTVAKLAGSMAKNMLNYSNFYSNFGVEDSADDDSIAPLGEGGRLALGPFLLGHIYLTLHDVVTDGMKPKHGGPLWAFQFWLQAYFLELRGAVNIADTEPLANTFAQAPRKHNTSTFCYKFFYGLVERTGSQFRVCLARPYPLFLAHNLSVIPDGETENDLREIWGSFLVAHDLHSGLSKAGAEVYLPNFVAPQFGLIQTASLLPLSTNRLSSSTAVWYDECISVRFIRPVEEAVRGALKNADWDPLLSKVDKGKKASAVLPRPSTQVAAVPRVAALPLARAATVTSTAAPTSRAPTVVGERKTLAHRTVPSVPPAQPIAVVGKPSFFYVFPSAPLSHLCPSFFYFLPLLLVEAAVAELPAPEEAVADMPDDEVLAVKPTRVALVEVPSAASAVPTLAVTASVGPLPIAPHAFYRILLPASPVVVVAIHGRCEHAPSAVVPGLDGSD